ncbi:MAG: hypothetical protein NVSMB64_01420 [Candidatus Velthaea sp.]
MNSPGLDLSLIPAYRRQRRIAYIAIYALVAIAALVFPFARLPLEPSNGFVPAIAGALIVVNLVTAALMMRQALLARRAALTVLACGYCAAAIFLIAYVALFPSVWEGPISRALPQASSGLWVAWHLTVPLATILYALGGGLHSDERSVRRRVFIETPLWSLLLTALVIFASTKLPPLTIGNAWQPIFTAILAPLILVVVGIAAAVLARRGARAALDLWLYIVLIGTALDVLVSLAGGARFSLGWYAARIDTFAASAVVLAALLWESGRLSSMVADAERRTRSLIDGVADALITIDDRYSIASFNPAAQTLFGYAPGDIGSLRIDDIIPNYRECIRAHGSAAAIETPGRHMNGRTFPLELAFGEGSDGEDRRTIVIARDITQRKRAEAAIKAARDQAIASAEVKAAFLATMSHEIRTPINAVVGMSELLLQSDLAPEAYDYAKTVRDSAEALLGVINDILDFSRIEAGKMEIDTRPFSPLSVLENAADICAGSARQKGLTLVSYVAPDVPSLVLGDASRVRQILINLIGNAVKFTPSGNVTARAVVDHIDGERTAIRFSVADTGPGIAPNDKNILFEAFRQADQSTRRRHGGTGLGLSISKRLTELMGGAIGVESTVGTGSTFWCTIPFEKSDEEEPQLDPERSVRGCRVLIVDDDDVSRAIIEQYCMSWGAIGTSTATPAHVIALLRAASARRAPYDAVIIDFQMPGVDGFALAARIQSDAAIASTPLILVTAHDEAGRGTDAIARGFIAYLRKPLKQSTLLDALHLALRGAPAAPAIAPRPAVETRDNVLVLVAEDNLVNRKLALQQLKKLGYRAHAVADGREAVLAAAGERYDVILMDCQMPELDGFAATQAIRRAETATGRHIPIVAMTANALEGDRDACLAAGMDEYLAKPVQLPELRAILERFTAGAVSAR